MCQHSQQSGGEVRSERRRARAEACICSRDLQSRKGPAAQDLRSVCWRGGANMHIHSQTRVFLGIECTVIRDSKSTYTHSRVDRGTHELNSNTTMLLLGLKTHRV